MQSFSFDKIMWQKGIKPPPLCFAPQNIGEVTRSGGGVDFYQKLFSYFFTVHRGDRNVFVDKKYIAEIHFHPMNFLLNH